MPTQTPIHWQAFPRALGGRTGELRLAMRGSDGLIHNRYPTLLPLPEIQPSLPYAVPLSNGHGFHTMLLDVDCDDPAARAVQVLALKQTLGACGIAFVEVTSGPGGRIHLLSTWQQPVCPKEMATVAGWMKVLAPKLDISQLRNVSAGAVRPPGSPHRHGGTATVVGDEQRALHVLERGNPSDRWDALRRLAPPAADDSPVQGDPAPQRARRPVSRAIASLLRVGDVDGQYPDRSTLAAAVTLGLLNAGLSFIDYCALAKDASNAGLEHLRTERLQGNRFAPRPGLHQACQRMWLSAERFAAANPAAASPDSNVQAELDAVSAALRGADWGGQRGSTERVVLESLLTLGRRLSRLEVSRSVRQLSEQCGRGKSAVAAALGRLAAAGWIVPVAADGSRAARTYRLALPTLRGVLDRTLALAPPTQDAREALNCPELAMAYRQLDLTHHEGLGHNAGYIADVLAALPGGADVCTLTSLTGLQPRTVRRHLRRLADSGIAAQAGIRWRITNDSPAGHLDDAARSLGVSGANLRRRDAHRADSATYAWYLADFHAERGYAAQRGLRATGRQQRRDQKQAVPRTPFPTDGGRRSWRTGRDLVLAGSGLQDDELARIDLYGKLAPPPASPTTRKRVVAPRKPRNGVRRPIARGRRPTHRTQKGGALRRPRERQAPPQAPLPEPTTSAPYGYAVRRTVRPAVRPEAAPAARSDPGDAMSTPTEPSGCPCGCSQTVMPGYSYAGTNERDRETHRSRANRRREAAAKSRAARTANAQGVLSELGIGPDGSAADLAEALTATAERLAGLASIVASDLHASDLDHVRDRERRLTAVHKTQLAAAELRADQANIARRAAEATRRDADAALSEAQQKSELLREAAADAVLAAEDAEARSSEAAAQAAELAMVRDDLQGQVSKLTATLAEAKSDALAATTSGEQAARELQSAHAAATTQEQRHAALLAQVHGEFTARLTQALSEADKRAVRERRAALRELRQAHQRELERVQHELDMTRRTRDTALRHLH